MDTLVNGASLPFSIMIGDIPTNEYLFVESSLTIPYSYEGLIPITFPALLVHEKSFRRFERLTKQLGGKADVPGSLLFDITWQMLCIEPSTREHFCSLVATELAFITYTHQMVKIFIHFRGRDSTNHKLDRTWEFATTLVDFRDNFRRSPEEFLFSADEHVREVGKRLITIKGEKSSNE